MMNLRAMALAVALASCRSGAPRGAVPTDAVAAPAVVDAGRSTEASLVELLHDVPCTVAVSSKVDNPKDFPEHLVDGKSETAWNSRTGDLHGYIAFRTPKVTRVRRVELTVGFDKGELFTKNHRIRRVRVSREGVTLAEATLDPEERGFQKIEIDAEGGDFRLDVLETVAGTEKKWKELTVSELRVWGFANGAPGNPHHVPAMAIGTLDGAPVRREIRGEPASGPFASIDDLCRAYTKSMAPLIKAAFPGDRYPGEIGPPHCERARYVSMREAVVAQGPFIGGDFVRVNEPAEEKARLALRTDKGFSLTNVVLWSRYHDDPGCGHGSSSSLEDAFVAKSATGRDYLVIRILNSDIYWGGATNPGGTVETAYACTTDAAGAAVCEGPLVTARSTGWPRGWDPALGKYPPVTVETPTWDFRKAPVLGPAGDLRLAPDHDK
jgi:hypothetical protein